MATTDQIRRRIANLTFGLERSGLATEEEIASVAARFEGNSEIDVLWEHWAELKALGLARISQRKKAGPVTENQLELAAQALAEKPEEVYLPSLKQKFRIHPASYARIERIEEHSFWINMLEAARSLLLLETTEGKHTPASAGNICPQCGRAREPGQLDDLLKRIREELTYQRAALYGQVVAPGPAPHETDTGEPVLVDWGNRLTPLEDALLMQGYHRVNYDVVRGLPEPRSADNERELPRSWAFLFASISMKENRPARSVMRDPSLASIIATFVLEEIKQRERERKRQAAEKN